MKALALALILAHAPDAPTVYVDPASIPRLWAIDGGVCLNDVALVASERDRQATRLQLQEAQTYKAASLLAVGVGGLVLGAVVGVVATSLARPH